MERRRSKVTLAVCAKHMGLSLCFNLIFYWRTVNVTELKRWTYPDCPPPGWQQVAKYEWTDPLCLSTTSTSTTSRSYYVAKNSEQPQRFAATCTNVTLSFAGIPNAVLSLQTNTTLTADVYRTCYAINVTSTLKTAPGLWNITGTYSCCK